ncbi:hypothetical protein GINT2_001076 [Glugoides intestinalis]
MAVPLEQNLQREDNELKVHQKMTEEELIQAVEKYKRTSKLANLFPIIQKERYRVVLMCTMFCIIAFNYSFLRLFKDRIVYSVLDNTETKNWLKLLTFLVTQSLVIFSQNVSAASNFNVAFGKLIIYFASFLGINTAFIIATKYLPVQLNDTFSDLLFLSDSLSIRGLKVIYPLCIVINQYTYSCFYVLSEVIGSMMISFCFMTYINNNTTENQNKRFVRLLLFFSNISSLLAGVCYNAWLSIYENKPKKESDIFYFIFPAIAIFLYMVVLAMKKSLEKEFLNEIVVSASKGAPKSASSKKKKVGFKDSLYLMMNSKFLCAMCGMTFFYNVTSNMLETANSSGMAASASYYGKDKSFFATGFKSFDLMFTSLVTCIVMVTPISLLPDRIGIVAFAMVPLAISVFAAIIQLFFSVTNFPFTGYDNMWPFNTYNAAIKYPYAESLFGTAMQSLMKISKYAFFDIVKELIAMKIDPANRALFKGVFDGSITKLGKSMGSLYGILMLSTFESFDARYYFPITALIILIFSQFWYIAIRYINKSYTKAKNSGTYMDPDMSSDVSLTNKN